MAFNDVDIRVDVEVGADTLAVSLHN